MHLRLWRFRLNDIFFRTVEFWNSFNLGKVIGSPSRRHSLENNEFRVELLTFFNTNFILVISINFKIKFLLWKLLVHRPFKICLLSHWFDTILLNSNLANGFEYFALNREQRVVQTTMKHLFLERSREDLKEQQLVLQTLERECSHESLLLRSKKDSPTVNHFLNSALCFPILLNNEYGLLYAIRNIICK